MKMYKKSDLTLIDGMLVCEESGDIIMPDRNIVRQANELETLKQKTEYLAAQPDATPMPSLDGFERKSDSNVSIDFTARTPMLDMEVLKSMKLMSELDDMNTVERANELLKDYKELAEFLEADYVVDSEIRVDKFDTPTLGSILEMKVSDLIDVVAAACGMDKDGMSIKDEDDDCANCEDFTCRDNPNYKD